MSFGQKNEGEFFHDYKKEKYYNKNIYYITEWDKYESIIKLQKRIIFRKKIKLLFYKIRSKMK